MTSKLEYKYLAPINLLPKIRTEVLIYMNYDPYAEIRPNKDYCVRSIYLDTADLLCYQEKYEGYKIRNKYRLRVYNEWEEESLVFLEIKRKNENFIFKDRARLYLKDLPSLLQTKNAEDYLLRRTNGISELEEANKFLFHYYSKRLFPSCLVIYEREAFMGKYGYDLRITFDKNLRGSIKPTFDDFYNEQNLKVAFPDFFILEIKFHQTFPAWIPRMITKNNLQRISVSKYTNCIDINKRQMRFNPMLAI
ncbi:MAG: polyphosphate polymerase domain-containing protein [Ignavibacteriaceae bacterium]|nr:polyphosphate polymerase domain-containing protein [Ignavibacteriaceae bacterium]